MIRSTIVPTLGKALVRGALVLALLTVPFIGHAHQAQAAPLKAEVWHYVQYGETLYSIARGYGVSVWSIATANGIVNPNYIRGGTYLRIPIGTGTPGGSCHYVQWGETLYSIAMHYGVSVWSIAYANGIVNPNYIRGGDCLVIP